MTTCRLLQDRRLLPLAAVAIVAPFLWTGIESSADVPDPGPTGRTDGLVVLERQVASDMVVDWLEDPPRDAAAWLTSPAAPVDHRPPGDGHDHDHAGDGAAATDPATSHDEPVEHTAAATTSGVYAAATPGQGFAVVSSSARWLRSGYTIRLAGGDARIEQFRDEVLAAAHAASTATGVPVRVAAGRGGSSNPSRGEITVILDEGPCGPRAVGCGGPALTTTELVSGRVWIYPSQVNASATTARNIAAHELGHALGLQHYSSSWSDGRQVMYPALSGTSTFRAGDSAGLRFMAGASDRPGGGVTGRTYAAGRMRVTGTVVSGSRVRVTVGSSTRDVGVTAGKFSADVPAGAGSHLVCATSLDAAPGFRRDLGCAQVNAPGQPFGVLDVVSGSFETIRVGGWAMDPQTAGPVEVEVRRNGKLVMTASAGTVRQDLATKHARYGKAHGFGLDVPAVAGANDVCVRVLGVGAGGNKDLGCRKVAHAVDPVGSFQVSGSMVSGWALDPNTPSAVDVTVTVDGAATPVLGTVRADDQHPEVTRSHPAHGPAHGFSQGLALILKSGVHEVCVTVTNVGLGRDRSLGCTSVRVEGSTDLANVAGTLGSTLPEVEALVGDVVEALALPS
jgi:hypothetical protein